jgi:hypothetical protein
MSKQPKVIILLMLALAVTIRLLALLLLLAALTVFGQPMSPMPGAVSSQQSAVNSKPKAQSPKGAQLAAQAGTPMALVIRPTATNIWLTLGWNGEPSVAGYNLYWGTNSGVYVGKTNAVTTNVTARLPKGMPRYYFAATSYNSGGIESPLSAQISFSKWAGVILFTNPTSYTVQVATTPRGPWTTSGWQKFVAWTNQPPPGLSAFYRLSGTTKSVQFAKYQTPLP